jgi:hypothetical protein
VTYYDWENIPFKALRRFEGNGEGEGFNETLPQKRTRSKKLAYTRALMINPNKTRITIVKTKKEKQVPLWVYRKYAPQQLSTI